MNILILLEGFSDDHVTRIDAQIEDHAALHDLDCEVRTASDRDALISALELVTDSRDVVIVSPEPGPGNDGLKAILSELECFSVEVQPENIARRDLPHAGADAELYGMRDAGYLLALDLVRERASR